VWAINAGLRHAKGDLILFTDDDILPVPDWLVDYAAAAVSQPDFDLFGGPVRLEWPCEPPAWAVYDLAIKVACFSQLDPPLRTGPCAGPLFGGNFAVRASAAAGQGGFDSSLGPRPGSYLVGDETEFVARLRAAGHRAWWIEDAAVEHIVRPEQVDRKWMLERAFSFGRGEYAREVRFAGSPKLVAGVPRWLIRRVALQAGHAAAARILGNERDEFVIRWHLSRYWGMLIQARQMRRREGGRQPRNES
jgi:glycosyltransferase involved in cell wall biosynthesis